MSPSFIDFNIIPDIDVIHTFDNNTGLTLPNESFTITGSVELTLTRPINIRQLYVQFQGSVDCVISASDFYFNSTQPADEHYGDEIPIEKWNTIDSSELGLMDKLTRKALGQANASFIMVDQRVNILNESQVLPIGKFSWRFSLTINDTHKLPSSIFLPHHLIQYNLSAKIKLNSLSERMKVTYWNARMNTLRIKSNNDYVNISSDNPRRSSDSSGSSPPPLSPTSTIATTESSHRNSFSHTVLPSDNSGVQQQQINTNNEVVISSTKPILPSSNSKANTRQLLATNKIIKICRHTYPSIYSLYSVQRIRYRGSRKERLNYEIGMKKFSCLQKKKFSFVCKFEPLTEECKIRSLEFFLEQNESYPLKAGDYNSVYQILPDTLFPRNRKFSRSSHDMQDYENGKELKLFVSLDLPHISPNTATSILNISHKLKLILKFENSKEKDMSLSFPLTIGTVPDMQPDNNDRTNIILQEDQHGNIDPLHVRQGLDQWLLTPDHPQYALHFDKLPSYMDAINEGNPPSPFIEDNF